jgi:hypothetical protein
LRNFGIPTPQVNQRVAARLVAAQGVLTTGVTSANTSLVWAINPEDLNIDDPARVTTVNTIAGAYQDNWGRGVGRIQLSGTTGWMKKEANGLDGVQFCAALRQLHADYMALVEQNNPEDVKLTILLPPGQLGTLDAADAIVAAIAAGTAAVNGQGTGSPTLGNGVTPPPPAPPQFGYYRVSSDALSIRRSATRPLLFSYTWQLTILDDLLASSTINPSAQFTLTGATGGDGTPGATPSGNNNASGTALSLPINANDPGQPPPGIPASSPGAQPLQTQQTRLAQLVQSALALQQAAGAESGDLLTTNTYNGVITAAQVAATFGITPREAQAYTQALNGVTLPTGVLGSPTTLIGPGAVLIGTTSLLGRDAGLL